MIEAGIPGFESQQWFGLFAPAALPKDIVARLHGETRRIMEYPDIRERLAADGGEPIAMTTDQFTTFIRADAARWMRVIKTSGASAD
jgi:tripartite-type tricarboxylate transporter receptor subunit TctC